MGEKRPDERMPVTLEDLVLDGKPLPPVTIGAAAWLALFTAVAGMAIMAAGVLVVVRQCFLWLRDGYWVPYSVRHVGSIVEAGPIILNPRSDWVGVNRIVGMVLDVPLSVSLVVVGFLIYVSMLAIAGVKK